MLRQSLAAPLHTLRHYSLYKLRKDLVAGLTVSVVEVPQSMAYALVAGVPPEYGLYTSIIQGVVGALLSSSEHITTGPTNTQSLLIASTVARLAGGDPVRYLQLVFALTLLKGVLQLAFAAARMGDLTRYVSRSVIAGLSAGAGVLIIASQLPIFLGLSLPRATHDLPGVLGTLRRTLPHLTEANPRAITIGVACVLVAVTLRWANRFLPSALIAIVVGAGLVFARHLTPADLPLVGTLPRAFPSFHVPRVSLGDLESLLGGAFALALLGSLESVAIAKSIAHRSGERISANQEFLTQGLKNTLTAFFQCIPGSVSFTRSALDYDAGAQTRFAAVFNGLFVAAIFWYAAPLAAYVPMAALAAVLFVIAIGLIDTDYFRRLRRTSREDFAVCVGTLAATLLAPLEYAIFIGVFLNIALYLRKASRLHLIQMVPTTPTGATGGFVERPIPDRAGNEQVLFLQLEGDLFFAVADELEDHLTELLRSPIRVFVFRLKRTHSIDATVLHVLDKFAQDLRVQSRHLILCGVRDDLHATLANYGLVRTIGPENVFPASSGTFTSARAALARAQKLLSTTLDTTPVDREIHEPEEFAYEI